MNVIRFSHNYPKLHGQTSAKLLAVEPIAIDEDTPEELIDYDTTTSDGSRYYLAPGEYLQLVFLGDLRIPFCTIRRTTYEKMRYYTEAIGKRFEIKVGGQESGKG